MKKDDTFYYFYSCPVCKKSRKILKTTLSRKPEYLQKCVICCREETKQETLKNFDWSERTKKIKQTCLNRYGVDNPSKLEKFKDKKKKTFEKHYGDGEAIREKQSQSLKRAFEKNKSEILKKRKQTCLEKYNCDAYTKTEEYKLRNNQAWQTKNNKDIKEIVEKRKQTKLEKYGDENYHNPEKFKQTCLKHFGVENPNQSNTVKEKIKQTCLSRYNTTCFSKSEGWKSYMKDYKVNHEAKIKETIQKSHETCLKKYGVKNAFLIPFVKQNRRSQYFFDNQSFDSRPELAFYIYCKDQNLPIRRCSKNFEYSFNNQTYVYFPDFEIDENFYEIKGSQFLTEDGRWQNPFDHSQDDLYEAKHQCALQNNVVILYSKDYQKYLDYIKQNFGKEYLNQFKT